MASSETGSEHGGRSQRMQQTRALIVQAALDLADEEPGRRLTAEHIAERAGVSRRTFFNYFPSVEAAIYAPVQQLLRAAISHLEDVPPGTPLLDTLTVAMAGATAEGSLERLGRCAHLSVQMPQLQGADLEQWEMADSLLSEVLGERYPHADPFVVRCLAGAVLGACRAALHEWDRRTLGGAEASADATKPPDALLGELIWAALHHVTTGFALAVDPPGRS